MTLLDQSVGHVLAEWSISGERQHRFCGRYEKPDMGRIYKSPLPLGLLGAI